MKIEYVNNKLLSIYFVALSFILAPFARANQPSSLMEGVSDGCRSTGDCELNDFLRVGIVVSKWILILSGSVALLAFVVGGLMMILSGGNKDMVQKGKNAITGAVIGIVIVLLAYTIIDFVLKKMGYVNPNGGTWNEVQ